MSEKPSFHPEVSPELRRESIDIASSPEVRWLRENHPIFDNVRFEENTDPTFEGGLFGLPEGEGGLPTVIIAAGGPERFARLKETRREAIEAMARDMGRTFESLTGKDIREFILYHEAGHTEDFLTNFHESSDADFSGAVAAWRSNSTDQLNSLPLPGASPAELREEIIEAGGFDSWRTSDESNAAWCEENGVKTERELLRIQEAGYRALDKEHYADRFAARMMRELAEKTDSAK